MGNLTFQLKYSINYIGFVCLGVIGVRPPNGWTKETKQNCTQRTVEMCDEVVIRLSRHFEGLYGWTISFLLCDSGDWVGEELCQECCME